MAHAKKLRASIAVITSYCCGEDRDSDRRRHRKALSLSEPIRHPVPAQHLGHHSFAFAQSWCPHRAQWRAVLIVEGPSAPRWSSMGRVKWNDSTPSTRGSAPRSSACRLATRSRRFAARSVSTGTRRSGRRSLDFGAVDQRIRYGFGLGRHGAAAKRRDPGPVEKRQLAFAGRGDHSSVSLAATRLPLLQSFTILPRPPLMALTPFFVFRSDSFTFLVGRFFDPIGFLPRAGAALCRSRSAKY